jgi:hypothetical protein
MLASVVLLLHLSFIMFVVLGGVLVLFWPPIIWLHFPALTWGLLVHLTDWACPSTSLENRLRRLSGLACYTGGFIEYYFSVVIGRARPNHRRLMNMAVLLIVTINLLTYSYVYLH